VDEGKEVAEKEEGTGRMKKKHFFCDRKKMWGFRPGCDSVGVSRQKHNAAAAGGGGVGNLFECI
jgi:hypothetical protein